MTSSLPPAGELPLKWPAGVPRDVEIPDEPVTVLLDRAAREHPDRIALDFLGATMTYRQLDEAAARGAAVLQDLGVRPGDRVAMVQPNSPSHAVGFWAALRVGAIVVENNPTYGTEQLAHQLRDSGASVALVWEKAIEPLLAARDRLPDLQHVIAVDLTADLPAGMRLALRLPVSKAKHTRGQMRGPVPGGVPYWHNLLAATRPLRDLPARDTRDLALIQYTGGTTGTPKGAMLTHRNLVANITQGHAWMGLHEGTEVFYAILPFFHAFGLTLCLVYAVRVAATTVVFPSFDPARVLAAQKRRPGTFLPAVTPMLDRLAAAAEASGADLTSFRIGVTGAMALPPETTKRWEKLTGGCVIEGYGMTETSPVAMGNPNTGDRRPGALGLPFPSTRIRVVDQDDPWHEVEPGQAGELLVNGPQVFAGYWNHPEETAHQLLTGGWVRTGDIVRIETDGFAVLVDRIKDMIVTGGFKVYPSQVEDRLREMPGVKDAAVVGEPAGDLGEHVVAAVVLEEDARGIDLAAVRAWCEARLARYALPKKLIILPDLPKSQLGKVLHRMVREAVLAAEAAVSPAPAPA